MTAPSLRITRLSPGIYDVRAGARTFECEQYPDGAWLLFERLDDLRGREFMNDFATLRDAKAAVLAALEETNNA